MTDALKAKKPRRSKDQAAPETHAQTEPLEQRISPQHNTTESYGKAEEPVTGKAAKTAPRR